MVLWAEWAWLGSSHLGPLMRLDGRESEWTPGDGDGQGGLACCDSWGRKESDTTERLNCTELKWCGHGQIAPNWTEVMRSWSDSPWTELKWCGHGQIAPEAGDAWGSSRPHIQDGVFPRVAGPRPGAPGTAGRQPSVSVFLPSAPQCGYVGFLAEWWPRGSEHDYLVAGFP